MHLGFFQRLTALRRLTLCLILLVPSFLMAQLHLGFPIGNILNALPVGGDVGFQLG